MKLLDQTLLIRWDKFKPGTSFFIPCIDRYSMYMHIKREAKRLHIEVTQRYVIENGIYGLRVWRNERSVSAHSASSPEA